MDKSEDILKICAECYYCQHSLVFSLGELRYCYHPECSYSPSQVTGKLKHRFSDLARDYGPCHKEATLYEPKPKIFTRKWWKMMFTKRR